MALSGALLLDKPSGVTSAGAVAVVKRLLPRKTKIGHTGTLDPLASGLLVLVIGRATRLSRYVTGLDKAYTATARFGAISDSLDADGEITALNTPMPTEDDINDAIPNFVGDIEQIPPMASAIKIGGERLYAMHRRGEEIERPARPVTIHEFQLSNIDPANYTATFDISCSSGTYIRSLISDLATSLNSGAYLTSLRRNSVAHLHVSKAKKPELLTSNTIHNHIIPPAEMMRSFPVVRVTDDVGRAVRSGRSISSEGVVGSFRVECGDELLAIYSGDGAQAWAEVVLCAE